MLLSLSEIRFPLCLVYTCNEIDEMHPAAHDSFNERNDYYNETSPP